MSTNGTATTGGRRHRNLDDLRREIALDRYEVDAHEVAEAVLRKLALLGGGRIALNGAPGPAGCFDRSTAAPQAPRARVNQHHQAEPG